MKTTKTNKATKTSTPSKTKRIVKVKASTAPIPESVKIVTREKHGPTCPCRSCHIHYAKPVQSFVGRVNVSKKVHIPKQPSRLTDIIACPTHAEFKEQVMAIATGNRFEFKGTATNTARGYIFYPKDYRVGAPSRPRIITWVKTNPQTQPTQ